MKRIVVLVAALGFALSASPAPAVPVRPCETVQVDIYGARQCSPFLFNDMACEKRESYQGVYAMAEVCYPR